MVHLLIMGIIAMAVIIMVLGYFWLGRKPQPRRVMTPARHYAPLADHWPDGGSSRRDLR